MKERRGTLSLVMVRDRNLSAKSREHFLNAAILTSRRCYFEKEKEKLFRRKQDQVTIKGPESKGESDLCLSQGGNC